MKKSLGSATTLKLFLSSPINTAYSSIELKNLNILTGLNNTGKSLALASVYMLNFIMSSKIIAQVNNASIDDVQLAYDTMVGCIGAADILTGTLALNYSNSASIDMAVNNGKVLSVTFNGIEDVVEPVNIIYMSAPFRTFQAMDAYLKDRKNCGKTGREEVMLEMLKVYRLYDVMYMESLIANMPFTVDASLKSRLEGFDIKEDLVAFGIDDNTSEFYAEWGNGARRPIGRWFGSGHQSLINMMLGSSL